MSRRLRFEERPRAAETVNVRKKKVPIQLKSPEAESEFDPDGMTAKDLEVSKFLAGFSMASTAESSTPSSTTTRSWCRYSSVP